MLRSNQLIGFGARRPLISGPEDPLFEIRDTGFSEDNINVYTHPNMDFGPNTPGREVFVVVAINFNGASTLTGITAGGVPLTLDTPVSSGASLGNVAYGGSVPGTSGDVVVTYSGPGGYGESIAVYRVIRTIPGVAATIVNEVLSSAPNVHTGFTVPLGGFCISHICSGSGDGTPWEVSGMNTVIHNNTRPVGSYAAGIGGSPGIDPGISGNVTWDDNPGTSGRSGLWIYD